MRVTIDEEGVTAAAYTVMAAAGAAMPPEEEMDFVLDRPFLFVIQGGDAIPPVRGHRQPAVKKGKEGLWPLFFLPKL